MTSYRFPHHGSKFFAGAHTRTLNVSHHSDSFLQSSFWMDARMLCEKDRKRDSDTEWRIYYLEWHLTVFLTTVTDPSLSLQDDALPWVLLYRQARKWLESRLCRLFNVILNGRKNALWEKQKTGQWHRVKNLLPWMTSYRFPHHGSKSFSADIQSNEQTASPIFSLLSLTHSSQLTAHSYRPSFPFRKIRVIYKNSGKRHSVFIYFHV